MWPLSHHISLLLLQVTPPEHFVLGVCGCSLTPYAGRAEVIHHSFILISEEAKNKRVGPEGGEWRKDGDE